MKVSRALSCISMMPRLSMDDITKEEALELWHFIDSPVRCPLTRQMARTRLAAEFGVFKDAFDAAIGSVSIVDALIWESSDSKTTNITLEKVSTFFSSDELFLIPLCHVMDSNEADFVWRWAFNERWRSVQNRMKKWVRGLHQIEQSDLPIPRLIEAAYNSEEVSTIEDTNSICRLKPWLSATSEIPQEWWLIDNVTTLRIAVPTDGRWVIRHRNGRIDDELTSMYQNTDVIWSNPKWIWKNRNLGHPNLVHLEPPSDMLWAESVQLIQIEPRSALLIRHNEEYYLLTAGTTSLYAQIIRVRRIDEKHYELELGFLDGVDIVEVCKVLLPSMPFELEHTFKRVNVRYNYGRAWHDVDESIVVRTVLLWTPHENWHLRFAELESDMGISDVSQLVDYQMLMGELDE